MKASRGTKLKQWSITTNHKLHEARQTPEGLHLVLGDEQERRKEVAHPLDVTWEQHPIKDLSVAYNQQKE